MTHLTGENSRSLASHTFAAGALVVGLLIGGASVYVFTQGKSGGIHSAMTDMTAGLTIKSGAEFEEAFLNDMIIHHEGAVEMAQMVLQKSQRPELVNLANDIITAQTAEITMMRNWQASWFGSTDNTVHSTETH